MRASTVRTLVACRAITAALLAAGATGALAAQVSAQTRSGGRASHGPVALDVQPFPGTPDASPQTDIAFPTLALGDVRSITVTGSRSGHHTGRMTAGASRGLRFVPAAPFVDGERVSVTATLSSPAAGTAAGAPARTHIRFSFGVSAPLESGSSKPSPATTVGSDSTAGYETRHAGRQPSTWTQSFQSASGLHPPMVWTSGSVPDPRASGDIFADVHQAYVQAGALIFNPKGQLVWFDPIANRGAAFNTQVQTYQGQQVLTFWQGYTDNGYGSGEDVILNHHYQTVATVRAGNGLQADLHAFRILPNGDALITAYEKVPNVNLSSVGGPKKGTLLDSVIQEINIASGQVVWEWHAYGHVTLSETYAGKPGKNPYDFFHINSVQLLPNGNLLVSARHTWTVYEINMKTGKIPYNFGGKNSSFRVASGANFEWQHDATMQSGSTMTLFDDGDGYYRSERQSRGLTLWIHYKSHLITVARAYVHNPGLLAQSQGSMQTLADGNTFVGWGSQPYMTEFSKAGKQLFNLHYSAPMESYRAYRFSWWGQPSTAPNIDASPTAQGTAVYASWNGASDVTSWRVLAGSSPSSLRQVATFPFASFETRMWVRTTAPYYAVQALGSGGGVRATSATVARGSSG